MCCGRGRAHSYDVLDKCGRGSAGAYEFVYVRKLRTMDEHRVTVSRGEVKVTVADGNVYPFSRRRGTLSVRNVDVEVCRLPIGAVCGGRSSALTAVNVRPTAVNVRPSSSESPPGRDDL